MGAIERVFRGRRGGQERPVAAIVAGLWKNGEQGVFYDTSDFYRYMAMVGPELLPEGTFDSSAGWNIVGGAGWVVSAGKASVNNTSGAPSRLNRAVYPPIGKYYVVQITVSSISAGNITLQFGNRVSPGTITNPGVYSWVIQRLDAYSFYLDAVNGTIATVETVSVKEWLGLDECTLFQDSSGTTPVTAVGQPVGLMLDKRFGTSRGPELNTTNFDANLAGWYIGVSTTATVDAGQARVTFGGPFASTNGNWFSLAGGYTPGQYYAVEFDATYVSGGNLQCGAGFAVGLTVTSASNAGVKTRYRCIVSGNNPTTNQGIAGFGATSAGSVWLLDNVSIKSVSGNHAYQATATSRPTLLARYNLLSNSENLLSGWTTFNGTFTQESAVFRFIETGATGAHSFVQAVASPKSGAYRVSFEGKAAGRSVVRLVLNAYSGNFCEVRFNLATGTVVAQVQAGDGVVTSSSITALADGYFRCTFEGKASAATTGSGFDVSIGLMSAALESRYTGDGMSGILVSRFDCRSATEPLPLPQYQRVADATNYDTAGFPAYLLFDGVDDGMQTAPIDFSGVTAMLIMAAVRKLSDAGRGIVTELGANGYGLPGSINIEQAWFSANWASSYSGATGSATVTEPGIGAPASAVVGSYANQIAPSIQLRYQGKARSTSTTAVGSGGFLNAPLYIGRRGGSSSPANMRLYGLLLRGPSADYQVNAVGKLLNDKARIY